MTKWNHPNLCPWWCLWWADSPWHVFAATFCKLSSALGWRLTSLQGHSEAVGAPGKKDIRRTMQLSFRSLSVILHMIQAVLSTRIPWFLTVISHYWLVLTILNHCYPGMQVAQPSSQQNKNDIGSNLPWETHSVFGGFSNTSQPLNHLKVIADK